MESPIEPAPSWTEMQARRDREALMRLRRREWVVLGILLVLAVLTWVNIKRVEVSGISMEPTFFSGDAVMVWKTVPRESLKPGDIIVFKSTDGDELIKRIVFIDNQSASGQFPPRGFPNVMHDGRGIAVPIGAGFWPYFEGVNLGVLRTPPPQNTIYVMGDNAMHSNDSRDFGPINPNQLLGKVLRH